MRGAKELDVSALRSQFGFVLDHATPIGEVITAAPTYNRVVADFEGTEAHAGIRPEDGHSAIAAAAAAIGAMELGRLDDETTANVGVISGGTASNVVAGECRIDAEARSLDESKASAATAALVDACTWAASEGRCDVDVDVIEMFRGYRLASAQPRCAWHARRSSGPASSHARRRPAAARCERADRAGVRVRAARERHRGEPHSSRECRRGTAHRDARGLRGDRPRDGRGGRRVTLKLRRGTVVSEEPLTVDVDGERRPAWADPATVGEVREGDEVVVNTEAVDLGLGLGGFDVVHVNLTRGLDAPGADGAHVMKLNYTSLSTRSNRWSPSSMATTRRLARSRSWSSTCTASFRRSSGRLPARASHRLRADSGRRAARRAVTRRRGAGRARAARGPRHRRGRARRRARGDQRRGRHRCRARSGWDACVAGPGPGILGSASRLGHGGLALDTLHAALALGMPTLLAPRLSSRPAGRAPRVERPQPHRAGDGAGAGSRPGSRDRDRGLAAAGAEAPEGGFRREALEELIAVTKGRHDLVVEVVDLGGYAASGRRPAPWAGTSTRTRFSSPRPWRRGRRWRRPRRCSRPGAGFRMRAESRPSSFSARVGEGGGGGEAGERALGVSSSFARAAKNAPGRSM